jgi:hypothetical protein
MPEKITGNRPSEVYQEFENLFKDDELVFSPFRSLVRDDGVALEGLNFLRVEDSEKFYRVKAGDGGYDIAVTVEEIGDSYEITQIRSPDSRSLSNYLEDHFEVN